MLLTNTLAAGAAGLVAAGLTVATMVPSSTAPEPVTDVTPTATQAPALACGAVRDRLPDALAEDLEALHDLEPGERRGALREIRRTALDGGSGNDTLILTRSLKVDPATGVIDGVEAGSPEMMNMTATGGTGADTFQLGSDLFFPDVEFVGGVEPAAGSAAEADYLATAFPTADDIGTITDFNPAEDTLVVEIPAASSGYEFDEFTTAPVTGATAIDLSIVMKHSTDATQPDLVRTIRLNGLTTFDTSTVVMVDAAPTVPAPAV